MLLELARSNAGSARIRWRSTELGSWDAVSPRWRIDGSRIRFQFLDRAQWRTCWISSVRRRPGRVEVLLARQGSPLPEMFQIAWDDVPSEEPEPGGLWALAKQWLTLRFPGYRLLSAAQRPDLACTLSGAFLRVLFHHGGKRRFLIAAEPDCEDEVRLAAGQALLWIARLAPGGKSRSLPALDILVPQGSSAALFHRCRFLNRNRVKVEVWEYSRTGSGAEFRRAPAPPDPEEGKDFRWPVLGPFRWSAPLERVLDLAPELIRRYPRFQDYDSLRLWGLEFAQVTGPERDRICFGIGTPRVELTDDNFDELRSLVREILYFRRPDSPDIRHPYYRLQAERWLEALILEDIARLFPEIRPESAYSQIPVYLGRESGRIDILGSDRQGTLVVMELKVVPDPDLPMQALDYWGRVIGHNENGDFERRGYFSGIRLSRRHPKIYLVSPVFSFHDTTELLLRFLEPGTEVWKVSVNEDWRCGVKIVRRVQCKCGE